MARDRNTAHPSFTSCEFCTHADATIRHQHWLAYTADLASHLRDSLPLCADGKTVDDARVTGILHWVHALRHLYGNLVDDRGVPLSVWEARRAQRHQYAATYTKVPGPHTPRGRRVAFRAFVHLLTAAPTAHAAGWRAMLADQFTEQSVTNETRWLDFCHFVTEYHRSASDPDNAPYLERIPTTPVLALATPKAHEVSL